MISTHMVKAKVWCLWLWIVDIWEFVVLLTLGFHPARSFLALHRDTKETKEIISTCLDIYQRLSVGSSLAQIKDLLSGCDSLSIVQLTTDDGYNLLQLAVTKSDLEFAEYLLREKKINPNISKCSLPLHIAINIGSMNMVLLLLNYKARLQQTAGMCFPEPHVPVYSSHSKFFFVSPSMVCGGSAKDAYQIVIDKDNVELLDLFLRRKSSSRLNVLLLHYACGVGATRCVILLIDEWKADINTADNRGCNAVMHSLHSHIEIIHYLISQGAEVSGASYQAQTVLHKLYCNTEEPVSDILEKTRLFLALGADNLLNNCDVFRNTALHYLCIKYSVYSETAHEPALRRCIGLLLSHNADTSMLDSDDYLPLQRILQCPCLSSLEEAGSSYARPSSTVSHTHHSSDTHRADRIYDIIRLFSQANPGSVQGVANKDNETVMFYILRMCFDYADLSYLKIINFLKDTGANINHVAVTQLPGNSKPVRVADICTRSLISVVRDRALVELKTVSETASDNICDLGHSLVTPVLSILFKAGLDPNAKQIECRTQGQAENVNALVCFGLLIRESHTRPQLELIEQWIRMILQWGGNPELQSYRPEPQICTSQGSIFLKQISPLPIMECFMDTAAHHWINNPRTISSIVTLLANSMSQTTLNHSLSSAVMSSVLSHIAHQSDNDGDQSVFFSNLVTQPRTLQMLARYQIYRNLNRQIFKEHVQVLPIPTSLKNMVSQIG